MTDVKSACMKFVIRGVARKLSITRNLRIKNIKFDNFVSNGPVAVGVM